MQARPANSRQRRIEARGHVEARRRDGTGRPSAAGSNATGRIRSGAGAGAEHSGAGKRFRGRLSHGTRADVVIQTSSRPGGCSFSSSRPRCWCPSVRLSGSKVQCIAHGRPRTRSGIPVNCFRRISSPSATTATRATRYRSCAFVTQECIVCHDRTADHIEAKRSSQAGLEHTRCASCHQEHHEPPHLVVSSDSLCSDCHSQPERFSSIRTLAAATGFSLDTHPKFDARLLRSENRSGATGLLFDWRFETTPIEGARESSNLKFPHDVHLDASKVRKPSDSAALGCADCHVLTADKEHFLPVTMVGHCRSCHDLKFDPKDPTRELAARPANGSDTGDRGPLPAQVW